MVYQLFGLAASLMVPFIPKIINAVVGSDSEATARAKLQPHYMDMVARFIGQGMNREQASRAAEEGIQGALHEAMNKEVLPPWVDDVATIAGIASGLGVTGGLKLLSSGAKLASAKMAQGGAKLAGKAAEMEKTADRINGITARGADPVRNAGLGKQIAKPAPAAEATAPTAPALGLPFSKSEFEAEKALASKPPATQRQAPQNSTRGDSVIQMPGDAMEDMATQLRSPFQRPAGLPAPRATSLEQELAASRASRNDSPIAMRGPIQDAEFEINTPPSALRLPFSKPAASPRRPAYQDIATGQSRDALLQDLTPSELRTLLAQAGQ